MASHFKEEAHQAYGTSSRASLSACDAQERAGSASTKRALEQLSSVKSEVAVAVGEEEKDYRDDAAYTPTGFGEIGNFMRNKRIKLAVQYQARKSEVEQTDGVELVQLFRGVRVHINGHTTTSGHTLRSLIRLLTLHGATYIPFIDRKSLVTHIIASNLTPSKRNEFKEYKVVKPEWIVESVKEGRLLDWTRFGLLGAAGREGEDGGRGAETGRETQRSLAGMFAAKGGGGDSVMSRRRIDGAGASSSGMERKERVNTETY